jgi:beta-phosphoglucomutase family hydrolase
MKGPHMSSTASTAGAPWGAVFDWDGVILDSSAHHKRSWELMAAEENFTLPEDHFERSFGMKNATILTNLLRWTEDPAEIARLSLRKEELYRELIRAHGVDPLPGVRTWLERLQEAGIPCVIGSSTAAANIELSLAALGLGVFFQAKVTAEDVSHGKPDPEVFLKAAGKIGMPPAKCVVFEDALVGIEAAKAAGMRVIGVTTTHPGARLDRADRVVDRLDELTIAEVGAWFAC